MSASIGTDQLEAIEVCGKDGEFDGYALVEAPYWYKGGARYSDAAYDRLVASSPRVLTPIAHTRSGAWAYAEHIVYVPGKGAAYVGGLA